MPLEIQEVTASQASKILEKGETHFSDFKAKAIKPSKLTKTLSGFANADGGELFVGVDDLGGGKFRWSGFSTPEDANGHIQALEQFFPLGVYFKYSFLRRGASGGYVLHIEIEKTQDIRLASDGIAYLRRGAQNLPQSTDDQITRLRYSKGLATYEDHPVATPIATVTESYAIAGFLEEVIPTADPPAWLRKQRLIIDDKPTVSGIVPCSDEPQIDLPKAGIKIYRYKTTEISGTRDTLAFDPVSIEGNAYKQIYQAVKETKRVAEEIPLLGRAGLEKIEYPTSCSRNCN